MAVGGWFAGRWWEAAGVGRWGGARRAGLWAYALRRADSFCGPDGAVRAGGVEWRVAGRLVAR